MKGKETEIIAGKGTIKFIGPFEAVAGSNSYAVELKSEQGPCTDDSCQVIQKIAVRPYTGELPEGYVLLEEDDVSLYIDSSIYRSIDLGRESVEIRISGKGKISIRGFVPVS